MQSGKIQHSAEGREGIKSQKGSSARPRLIMLELQKSSVDFLVFNNKKHTAHSHRHTQTGKKKQKCVTLNEKKYKSWVHTFRKLEQATTKGLLESSASFSSDFSSDQILVKCTWV